MEGKRRFQLLDAAREGDLQRMLAALEQQCNHPDVVDPQRGCTALHMAADGGHEDCLRALVERGASVEAADTLGLTALHWAAAAGREPCLQALLDAGSHM